MSSYLLDLRKFVGPRKLIHPGARIILENEKGEILLIRRRDTQQWGLIAGGLEEEEDIQTCIRREVQEETGLTLTSLTAIGLSTDPALETTQYPNGDVVQYFTMVFYSNSWEGQVLQQTAETSEARFFPLGELPALPPNEAPALGWLVAYKRNGQFIVR